MATTTTSPPTTRVTPGDVLASVPLALVRAQRVKVGRGAYVDAPAAVVDGEEEDAARVRDGVVSIRASVAGTSVVVVGSDGVATSVSVAPLHAPGRGGLDVGASASANANASANASGASDEETEAGEPVPQVGSVVLGRVTRVTPKLADVQILVVNDRPTRGAWGFKGTLRKENVRAHEVDLVDMYDCFRQGDVVRAGVAALGGARSYELTTADNRFGVVHAVSAMSGEPLVPVSWEAMVDPVSQNTEKRKVADVRDALQQFKRVASAPSPGSGE